MNISIRQATATESFAGSFIVTVNGKQHRGLGWGEMMEVVIAATRGFEAPYESGEEPIAVLAAKSDFDQLSHGLSDLLCWVRGFTAALPDDPGRHPIGIEAVRSLNIKIKEALNSVKESRT